MRNSSTFVFLGFVFFYHLFYLLIEKVKKKLNSFEFNSFLANAFTQKTIGNFKSKFVKSI